MRKVWLAVGLLAVLVVFYCAAAVLKARHDTPAIVRGIYESPDFRMTVKDLTPWQQQALLAIEDPSFYRHHGVDLRTPGQGITTLTQGLAKKLYFHPFKPGIRKLKLMLLAWLVVDPIIPKDEQLTLFLNLIYLGNKGGKPVIGFAEASQAYYGKPLKDLTEYEYLSIVAMIIAPNNFSILDQPEANRERTLRIQNVVSGEYKPRGLMDLYYGPLPEKTQQGLAPASYFPGIYKKKTGKNNRDRQPTMILPKNKI